MLAVLLGCLGCLALGQESPDLGDALTADGTGAGVEVVAGGRFVEEGKLFVGHMASMGRGCDN